MAHTQRDSTSFGKTSTVRAEITNSRPGARRLAPAAPVSDSISCEGLGRPRGRGSACRQSRHPGWEECLSVCPRVGTKPLQI